MDGLADLDPEGFSKIVEEFLNLIEKWRDVIQSFRADETESSGDAAEESPALGRGGPSGFMQV